MRVETKADFYLLSHAGLLGNTIRQWEYEEYLRSGFPGFVAVRHKIPGSPWCKYDMTMRQTAAYVEKLVDCHGATWDEFQVSEIAPDHLVTIQGEVMRSTRSLDMRFVYRSGTHMRPALAMPHVDGYRDILRLDLRTIHTPENHCWPANLFCDRLICYTKKVMDVHGSEAAVLLRWFMDGQSRDFLAELWDSYPDAVVEFGCYERPVGILGWNTLFWEARDF